MILYVAENLSLIGMGGGVAAYHELLALLRCDCPVTVLTRGKVSLPRIVEGKSIEEPRWMIYGGVAVPSPPEFSRPYLRAQFDLMRFTAEVRRLKPKLIVVQEARGHRHMEMYRSWDSFNRVITVQGSPDSYRGIYHDGVDSLSRVAREMASYRSIIHVSQHLKNKWDAVLPTRQNARDFLIANTIDEAMANSVRVRSKAELRNRLGIPGDVFALVCTASIQKRKGQDVLIKHLDDLLERIPALHLFLVGPAIMHWGGREILTMIEKHPRNDRIHLLQEPRGRDAMAYTRAADVYILPTREEAMPLSILEAMYLDTPVVASDVDGIPDEIEDGQSGLLFSHNQPEKMVDAVVRMASDQTFRSACAQQGRLRYEQYFTRRHFFDQWSSVVQTLI